MELKLYGEEKIRVQVDHAGNNFIDIHKAQFDDNAIALFHAIDCDIEVWEIEGGLCVVSKKDPDTDPDPVWYERGRLVFQVGRRKRSK